ncbi:MAG: hypothetical protein GQ582_04555 [Methyloprofundus sp.]|nr:hypothetical protein [Methyloprofundus sp.]
MFILNYSVLFIFLLISACASHSLESLAATPETVMINLSPLSPYQYEFIAQDVEKNTIYYFFTERKNWQNKLFREALEKRLAAIQAKGSENYTFFSVYVYARTEQLNKDFKGDNKSLHGIYDADLISYTRWKQGELDIFYLIESGNVVFDLLKNTAVSPRWEFD